MLYMHSIFVDIIVDNMNKSAAISVLRTWDKQGKCVFTKHMLAKFFFEDSAKTFSEGLNRLVKDGILQRVCRGVYVNKDAVSNNSIS